MESPIGHLFMISVISQLWNIRIRDIRDNHINAFVDNTKIKCDTKGQNGRTEENSGDRKRKAGAYEAKNLLCYLADERKSFCFH